MSAQQNILKKLAHDMRTPISIVMGYVHYKGSTGVISDEENLYLKAIEKSLVKLEEIANQLSSMRELAAAPDEVLPHTMSTQVVTPGSSEKLVLLVDDNEGIRLQWKQLLKNYDYKFIEAPNGEALLGMKLDYSRIHAAVVDYHYEKSDLNGLDVLEYLKRKSLDRVFLCTGNYDDKEVVAQAYALGVKTIIEKPLNPERTLSLWDLE